MSEKIGRIVTGFRLQNMLEMFFCNLSGGEKRIVLLASIMINQPDILLLDEPTNHLDIETLEWFEDYLNQYQGTIVIVSHERYFINKVANKIISIEKNNLVSYLGNYDNFRKKYLADR